MVEAGKKTKKRQPRPHSLLCGMRGQSTNNALDFGISCNSWCVVFKDDDGKTVVLVDECVIRVWLKYICDMKGHPDADSNDCQMVFKYMLVNRLLFIKTYHNRAYAYSSGTKFTTVCAPLKKWLKKREKILEDYDEDTGVSMHLPTYIILP